MLKPSPQWDGIWRRSPREGTGALINTTQESSLAPSAMWGRRERQTLMNQGVNTRLPGFQDCDDEISIVCKSMILCDSNADVLRQNSNISLYSVSAENCPTYISPRVVVVIIVVVPGIAQFHVQYRQLSLLQHKTWREPHTDFLGSFSGILSLCYLALQTPATLASWSQSLSLDPATLPPCQVPSSCTTAAWGAPPGRKPRWSCSSFNSFPSQGSRCCVDWCMVENISFSCFAQFPHRWRAFVAPVTLPWLEGEVPLDN